jgi:hypothetical protein
MFFPYAPQHYLRIGRERQPAVNRGAVSPRNGPTAVRIVSEQLAGGVGGTVLRHERRTEARGASPDSMVTLFEYADTPAAWYAYTREIH